MHSAVTITKSAAPMCITPKCRLLNYTALENILSAVVSYIECQLAIVLRL